MGADREAVVILSHPGLVQPVPEPAQHPAEARAQAATAWARSVERRQQATQAPGETARLDAERFATMQLETQALMRRLQEVWARARATREQIRRGRSQREILHDSAYARLAARLESMPVIEQAKGIIMAQQGCGPQEAFDLLRQASQRTNVKLSVLAARIVARVASSTSDGAKPKPTAATDG